MTDAESKSKSQIKRAEVQSEKLTGASLTNMPSQKDLEAWNRDVKPELMKNVQTRWRKIVNSVKSRQENDRPMWVDKRG